MEVPVFPAFRAMDNGLFAAITSPREGVFCFPVKGRRMAADMPDVLAALKARFVDQEGLTPQQAVEQAMARTLCRVLANARILPAYKRDVKIGPEEYQVTFALAHLKDTHKADRALRPLNFDLATSTDIFNHGDQWIQRLNRLQRMGYRPDQCLLALRAPHDDADHRGEAYHQIRAELANHDFVLATEEEAQKVVEFARLPEAPVLKLA